MASQKKNVLSPRDRARAAKAAQEQDRKARDRRVETLVTDWYAGIDRREQLQSQVDANEARLAGTVVALCDGEGEPVAGAAQLLDVAAGQVQAMRARHKKQSPDPGQPGGVALVPSTDEATGRGADVQGPADDVVAS